MATSNAGIQQMQPPMSPIPIRLPALPSSAASVASPEAPGPSQRKSFLNTLLFPQPAADKHATEPPPSAAGVPEEESDPLTEQVAAALGVDHGSQGVDSMLAQMHQEGSMPPAPVHTTANGQPPPVFAFATSIQPSHPGRPQPREMPSGPQAPLSHPGYNIYQGAQPLQGLSAGLQPRPPVVPFLDAVPSFLGTQQHQSTSNQAVQQGQIRASAPPPGFPVISAERRQQQEDVQAAVEVFGSHGIAVAAASTVLPGQQLPYALPGLSGSGLAVPTSALRPLRLPTPINLDDATLPSSEAAASVFPQQQQQQQQQKTQLEDDSYLLGLLGVQAAPSQPQTSGPNADVYIRPEGEIPLFASSSLACVILHPEGN